MLLGAVDGTSAVNLRCCMRREMPQKGACGQRGVTRCIAGGYAGVPQLFATGRKDGESVDAELTGQLYQQIGQLKVELDWLKKKLG